VRVPLLERLLALCSVVGPCPPKRLCSNGAISKMGGAPTCVFSYALTWLAAGTRKGRGARQSCNSWGKAVNFMRDNDHFCMGLVFAYDHTPPAQSHLAAKKGDPLQKAPAAKKGPLVTKKAVICHRTIANSGQSSMVIVLVLNWYPVEYIKMHMVPSPSQPRTKPSQQWACPAWAPLGGSQSPTVVANAPRWYPREYSGLAGVCFRLKDRLIPHSCENFKKKYSHTASVAMDCNQKKKSAVFTGYCCCAWKSEQTLGKSSVFCRGSKLPSTPHGGGVNFG